MGDLSERFLTSPAISFLGAAVPEGDHVVHVAHEDCVVSEIEKVGAFAQRFVCLPKFFRAVLDSCFELIARLSQSFFSVSAFGAHPTRQYGQNSEDYEKRDRLWSKSKRVQRLNKIIVDRQLGEDYGEQSRSHAAEPRADDDSGVEKRRDVGVLLKPSGEQQRRRYDDDC